MSQMAVVITSFEISDQQIFDNRYYYNKDCGLLLLFFFFDRMNPDEVE